MQWTSSRSKSQQQGTRRVFIVWIIFNDFRFCTRFADFLLADISLDRTTKSMSTELKLTSLQLPLYLGKRFHFSSL